MTRPAARPAGVAIVVAALLLPELALRGSHPLLLALSLLVAQLGTGLSLLARLQPADASRAAVFGVAAAVAADLAVASADDGRLLPVTAVVGVGTVLVLVGQVLRRQRAGIPAALAAGITVVAACAAPAALVALRALAGGRSTAQAVVAAAAVGALLAVGLGRPGALVGVLVGGAVGAAVGAAGSSAGRGLGVGLAAGAAAGITALAARSTDPRPALLDRPVALVPVLTAALVAGSLLGVGVLG